ncbi:tubulin-folding cofactor B [Alligator sinensis]|uniref:Tubulin-folding cofactor B n=1 Tax=Alligator sinensis TaxID=38654 RepID=A0A1U7S0K8_ALLSI|nr:tubulin-folding cofactor B [Alligator sinensis]
MPLHRAMKAVIRAGTRAGRGVQGVDAPGPAKGRHDTFCLVHNSLLHHPDAALSSDARSADSVRSFLKRSKKGRFNEEEVAQKEAEQAQKLAEEKALAEAITVGARCEVRMAGQPLKRGTVMYVGLAEFKPGYWIGIKYDEPLGKHDGSVNGQRYFECQPKYGAFVKPQHITVGDFPEEDYGLEDEM